MPTVGPGSAGIILTGYAPTVPARGLFGWFELVASSAGTIVQPGTGALTLTGFAPTVATTTNAFARPTTGALVLTGFRPSVAAAGRIYQVYAEIPEINRAGRIYQVYGAIPDAVRTGRIYQVYASIASYEQTARIFQVYGVIPSLATQLTGGPAGEGDIVATFDRMLPVIHATAFERPRGKSSWSNTGRGQFRASITAGLMWEETYQPARLINPVMHGFLAYLRDLQQNERIFEIDLSGMKQRRPTLLGTETGTVLVSGADQVGYSLVVTGMTGTLLRGDLIRIEGLTYTMDVVNDASGSPLAISPQILAGGSPADGAEVLYGDALSIRAKIDGLFMPEVDSDQIYIGLRVRFREVP